MLFPPLLCWRTAVSVSAVAERSHLQPYFRALSALGVKLTSSVMSYVLLISYLDTMSTVS